MVKTDLFKKGRELSHVKFVWHGFSASGWQQLGEP